MRSETKRNSAFELVRIFAMLLIICHHIVWYGGAMNVEFSNAPVRCGAQVFFIGGALGVDIFFMLSGYFGVGREFRSRRIVRLDAAMIFYSLLFWAITAAFMKNPPQTDMLTKLRAFFPISLFGYWFMSVYVIVYLLSPMFSMIMNRLTRAQLTFIGVFMLLLVSVVPAAAFPLEVNNLDNVLLRGIYGWFIGAYLKKYSIKFLDKRPVSGAVFVLSFAALSLISIYSYKNNDAAVWKAAGKIFLAHNSILMFLCSAALMSFAAKIKIGEVKAINFVSQTVMGVYLIHEAPAVRSIIWNKIFKIGQLTAAGGMYVPKVLGTAAAVFVSCAAIELVRIYAPERVLNGILKKCTPLDRADALMEGIK